MKPSRSTRRHPDSPRVQELLDAMQSSPLQSRDGLLLFACLLMLRLIDQRERDLSAVAEFEGRRHNSILPEPDLWQRLVSQNPDRVGGFLGGISSTILRRQGSSGTCQIPGAARCNNMLVAFTAFMTINAKSLFMTTSMEQYPYCPPCIPSVSGGMRPWDTKFKIPIQFEGWDGAGHFVQFPQPIVSIF